MRSRPAIWDKKRENIKRDFNNFKIYILLPNTPQLRSEIGPKLMTINNYFFSHYNIFEKKQNTKLTIIHHS